LSEQNSFSTLVLSDGHAVTFYLIFFLLQGLKLLSTLLSCSNLAFKLSLKLGQLGVQNVPDLHGDAGYQSGLLLQKTHFRIVFLSHALASFNTALHQICEILLLLSHFRLLLNQFIVEHFEILRFLFFSSGHLRIHGFDHSNLVLDLGILNFEILVLGLDLKLHA